MDLGRGEMIKLVIRMALLSTCAYFGSKWLITQLDPTNLQKKRSKETVSYIQILNYDISNFFF